MKKGDTVKVLIPAHELGPESVDIAIILTVLKSGKIRVRSELGYGYTINTASFLEKGGKIEAINA